VRNISAILIICIFAISQYAKQLSYVECKFSNTFKPFTAHCDCEKRLETGKSANAELPVPKTHTHLHPDDFFFINLESLTRLSVPIPGEEICCHSGTETEGILHAPFRPPRC
jgi:hypothetical protein